MGNDFIKFSKQRAVRFAESRHLDAIIVDSSAARERRVRENAGKISMALTLLEQHGRRHEVDGKFFIIIDCTSSDLSREQIGILVTAANSISALGDRSSFVARSVQKGHRNILKTISCEVGEFDKLCAEYGVACVNGNGHHTRSLHNGASKNSNGFKSF